MSSGACECVIIGGGPAGLTAAIYLARYRRNILVLDNGKSRAAWIPKSHNYPGFHEGISGIDLLGVLRKQAEDYRIQIVNAEVTDLQRGGAGFVARYGGDRVEAQLVLLATGIVDESPKLPGLPEAISEGLIRYCPVCDGYEVTDRRIAVLGQGTDAASKAIFLRTYSSDVTLVSLDQPIRDRDAVEKLRMAGVKTMGPVAAIERDGDKIRVAQRGAAPVSFDVMYPALGCSVRSDLASALGAKTNDVGCLEVDAHQRTTVPGLYAAGDVVSDLHQIVVATSHAAVAATHIHKTLAENFRDARSGALMAV